MLASLNTDETKQFYTEKLGFTFYSEWDGYLIFGKDGVMLHFWSTDNPDIPKATGCYINVTNVDELFEAYKVHGVVHPDGVLKDMEWGMRQFSILDNNGNIIHFGEDISEE